MRNNLSFLIDERLSLYEHQSTVNPNLCLRFLFYISDIYSGMEKREKKNLYSQIPLVLPMPHFVIFYNGVEPQPDRQILRLSDLYTVKTEEWGLELEALIWSQASCSLFGMAASILVGRDTGSFFK